MNRLIIDLKGLPDDVAVWLRAPAGAGRESIAQLRSAVGQLNLDEALLPEMLVLDPHLAREREAGLYVAADAVYVDEAWPDSEVTARRGADCGRMVLRGAEALSAWAHNQA